MKLWIRENKIEFESNWNGVCDRDAWDWYKKEFERLFLSE